MIGVVIAAKVEWNTLLEIYNIDDSHLEKYPYGEFYRTTFKNKDVVFFRCGIRKINAAAATQYMIDRFDLDKIIVLGTCAASNDSYDYLDVLIPERVIDYDGIIRECTDIYRYAGDLSNDKSSEALRYIYVVNEKLKKKIKGYEKGTEEYEKTAALIDRFGEIILKGGEKDDNSKGDI